MTSASPVLSGDNPSPARRIWTGYRQSTLAMAALLTLCAMILLALLSPWLVAQDPYDLMQLDVMDGRLAPGSSGGSGITHWLGTDDQGRDILAGILYGLRISLGVAVSAALVAVSIGTVAGIFAAYVGGRSDALIMRIVDLQLSFPAILVALMILAFLGRGIFNVILAIVIVEWATYARTARAAALVERRREYIEAAQCLELSSARILFRHLLPNCLTPLIVVMTAQFARAIAIEATLSFLGLGVRVTEPSLGMLIANGQQYMFSGSWWIAFYPGLALLVTIVAANLIGDRLRDVLNPRSAA